MDCQSLLLLLLLLLLLIHADGQLAWNYLKAFPVPFLEAGVQPGPPVVPTAESAFGRLAGAICFDLDHPLYMRQARHGGKGER
jgi:apolipoprotein N-acyltransferase